ncbi:MAG TPA: glycerophosphodiester phosphodiesterase family protein [Cellulomonas sp.]
MTGTDLGTDPRVDPRTDPRTDPGAVRPLVVAHRGNSAVAPQNTLAAFEAAWRAGAGSIELDVQLTADGHVVVIHDDTVDATTDGTGTVTALSLAETRALDAGSWFSPAYRGQRVPTFAEVVDLLVRRPGIDLLLEIKGSWDVEQVRLVTGPIAAAGLRDRVIGQSFWPETVAAVAEADPGLRRGLLVGEAPDDLVQRCTELGAATCNPHGGLLEVDPGLVGRLHAAGVQVMVWTLDEPEQWAAALALGVDAIITDRPDRLVGWLDARLPAA